MTRRRYLTIKAMEAGASWPLAVEAVASTAIEHPEWDMDETKTYEEWETQR
jgi:hypothetical protein